MLASQSYSLYVPLLLPLLLLVFTVAVPRPLYPASATANCSTISKEIEGPYWVDEHINSANLRGDVPYGVPLNLTFMLLDARTASSSNMCVPLANAQVDIWHSRYDGKYSDEETESTQGEVWLRGYQLTNSSGYATFYTIYPGWYVSRSVHVHVRVRLYTDNSTASYDETTQLFFDDAITDAIDTYVYPYNARHTRRDTTNSKDKIYSSNNLISISGNYNDSGGYSSSTIVISVPFADNHHRVKCGGSGLIGDGNGLSGGSGDSPSRVS